MHHHVVTARIRKRNREAGGNLQAQLAAVSAQEQASSCNADAVAASAASGGDVAITDRTSSSEGATALTPTSLSLQSCRRQRAGLGREAYLHASVRPISISHQGTPMRMLIETLVARASD